MAYDRARNGQNQIKILEEDDFFAFSFPEVGYFNYAFTKDNQPFEKGGIERIQAFYNSRQIRKHRIKIPFDQEESRALLEDDYIKIGTIVKTYFPVTETFDCPDVNTPEFVLVDESNIVTFTKVYLDSFEAVGRDPEQVAENFRGLLTIPGTELYLVRDEGQNAGIVVLYGQEHHYFLAGGAILPGFRNKDYHKSGLRMRIRKCLRDQQLAGIYSWADKDGISHQNMVKLNMVKDTEFDIYEFTK